MQCKIQNRLKININRDEFRAKQTSISLKIIDTLLLAIQIRNIPSEFFVITALEVEAIKRPLYNYVTPFSRLRPRIWS